jgi:predicted NUDIX family NTP pyrophosphohydrolase
MAAVRAAPPHALRRRMAKRSAGIVPYRRHDGQWQVLLVHPGGPFWARKDDGAWSIAKGEVDADESTLDTAVREFQEETGRLLPGPFQPLRAVRLKSGKVIDAWATEHDWDLAGFESNTFALETPRGSGVFKTFPEVDRVQWFDLDTAMRKIHAGQMALLVELREQLS